MVSTLHESVLELVRDRPEFAAHLLHLLDVEVPSFKQARLGDVTFNQIKPAEYCADAVVLFTRKTPVFGVILEAQLKADEDKPFTWPLYAVAARARHRCPFVVVVVAPKRSIARWAAQKLHLGGGNEYRVLTIGPDGVPKVTDRRQARREPQLATLSVIAHGKGDVGTAVAVGSAAAWAIKQLPEEQQVLYSLLLKANLSMAARKAIEMQPGLERFFDKAQKRRDEHLLAKGKIEGKIEGKLEGKVEGKAEAVLQVLTQRGLSPTPAQQRRIKQCSDAALLERWLTRSLSADSVAAVLAPETASHHGRRHVPASGRRRK